jgi:hypothetical protein
MKALTSRESAIVARVWTMSAQLAALQIPCASVPRTPPLKCAKLAYRG